MKISKDKILMFFFQKIKKQLNLTHKHKIVLKPLFPGYLFVEFNNKYNWLKINSTYGVSKIVQFGEKPIYVPIEFLKDLKKNVIKMIFVTIKFSFKKEIKLK